MPGVVIGVPRGRGRARDRPPAAVAGRALAAGDAGAPVVLLERNFAEVYELPASGVVSVAGGRELAYVGHASAPDYFVVMSEDGSGFQVQANFAALFTSLETAQGLAGAPGQVNRLLIRLADGADPVAAAQAVDAALADRLPEVGVTVVPREEHSGYAMIYQDIENDQQTFSIFAMLIFVGAVAAAFNLTARLVEAQRREIGIAMALGVPRRRIAIRPLLVAAQIALLGVVLGVGVGEVIGVGMRQVLEGFFPLPIWVTSFQAGAFGGAAAVGFAVPFAAAAYPCGGRCECGPSKRSGQPTSPGGCACAWWPASRRPGNTFRRLPGAQPGAGPAPHPAHGGGHRRGDRGAHRAARHDRFLPAHDRRRGAGDPGRAGRPGDRGVRRRVRGGRPGDRRGAGIGRPWTGQKRRWPCPAAWVRGGELRHRARLDRPGRLDVAAEPGGRLAVRRGGHRRSLARRRPTSGWKWATRCSLTHPRRTGEDSYGFGLTVVEVIGIHAAPYRFLAYMDASQAEGDGPRRRGEPGECHPGAGLQRGRREALPVRHGSGRLRSSRPRWWRTPSGT